MSLRAYVLGDRLHAPTCLGVLLAPVLAALLSVAVTPTSAQDGGRPRLSAQAVILIDRDGQVILDKNATTEHPPASLVKLMTLYLAYEDLEAGRVRWADPVTVSHRAARTPRYRMGFRAGAVVPFGILLKAIAMGSANDAAVAAAEHLAGDEERFVTRMNAKAHALGLTRTRFVNPHGLPGPTQHSTARDLVALTQYLLRDHPAVQSILGGKLFVFRGRVYRRRMPSLLKAVEVHALKTGFTREAGYNLALAASRDGERLVAVILGARTRRLSIVDARKLLRYGHTHIRLENSTGNGRPAVDR